MRKSQLDFLCETFGDPNLSNKDKWKCIKYIFIENPIIDVQLLLKRKEIQYIDNTEIGPGFYILGCPHVDFGIPKFNDKVITFIPLKMIDKLSLIASHIDINSINNNEFDIVIS